MFNPATLTMYSGFSYSCSKYKRFVSESRTDKRARRHTVMWCKKTFDGTIVSIQHTQHNYIWKSYSNPRRFLVCASKSAHDLR